MGRIVPIPPPVVIGEEGPELFTSAPASSVDAAGCEYCGSRYVDERGNCGACGAPLPALTVNGRLNPMV